MFFRRTLWLVALWPILALLGAAQDGAPKPALDVRAHGARCDGVSDDAAAFQAALDAADPSRGGSGSVFVAAGAAACVVGSPLVLRSGETLWARPGTATLAPQAPYPDPARNPILALVKNVSGVTIRGLSFDGNADRVGTSSALVTVFGSDHVLIDQVQFRNARGIALVFSGGQRGVQYSGVQNSTFDDIGMYYLRSGDKQRDRKQAVAFCCGAQDSGGDWNNRHNFAKSNKFGHNGFDNLSFGQQSWFTASGNTFGGTSNGGNIYCSHNSHVRIVDNVARAATGNGIDCWVNTDLTIAGNESSMNGAAGIQAADSQCGLIANNRTLDNFQSGSRAWNIVHPEGGASRHRGGITIGGEAGDTPGTADVVIRDNISGNTQPARTQAYGIQVRSTASVRGLLISPDNKLIANALGPYGEQATGPTAAGGPSCRLWAGD